VIGNIEHVHSLVSDAERYLRHMLQEPESFERVTMYTFTFTVDGNPIYHHIPAKNIKEAFAFFGNILLIRRWKASCIDYGEYLEMEDEQKRIDHYWEERKR
jgi:hypothetical protein